MAANRGPIRVLVVGQTPPPFGGQAVMIREFLGGHYQRLRLFHVRLAFSDDMESVGKFSLRKVSVLFGTLLRIWMARLRHGTGVLYYPPAGPNKVPVMRDIALLCATRWLFRHVVFHFHAGGVSSFAPHLPGIVRPFFRSAYHRPTVAIRTAEQNPDDGLALGALHDRVVANGIPDQRGTVQERTAREGEPLVILFTGVLIESKGVRILLEAFAALVDRGINARLEVMGKWGDEIFRGECMRLIASRGIGERVRFLGEKREHEKFGHFAACDVFCFPSFFEAESFGLVLLEAMMFAKPVVSTRWRGIPSVVQDGVNGWLVEIRDAGGVADRLEQFARDPALRESVGRAGRRIFEERFTVERFRQNMEATLVECLSQSDR